jgi:pimeloyl-ACP methyl ester carboxylesterase
VLTGRYEVATTPAHARRIHELPPGGWLEIFERSGHHPWVEEPGPFTRWIDEFLADLTPDSREDDPS